MKFDFRSENFKRKFSSNLFACNLIIGCSKKNSEKFSQKPLNKEIKKAGLKFNPGFSQDFLINNIEGELYKSGQKIEQMYLKCNIWDKLEELTGC